MSMNDSGSPAAVRVQYTLSAAFARSCVMEMSSDQCMMSADIAGAKIIHFSENEAIVR